MSLEKDFHREMVNIYNLAIKHCNYRATRFIQMVANEGGLKTAKKLLIDKKVNDGFLKLHECDRLDLTVETLVLNAKYSSLFTNEELENARETLSNYW
jgi:hypothetical protein